MHVPCGQCIGCRLDHSRQWALRCLHEAKEHESNCFLTLTYDDDHLPLDHSLNKTHFQSFMKHLRHAVSPTKIRFFHCGEYGEKLSRPHYHALIFGYDFPDKVLLKQGKNPLYTSPELSKIWKRGFSTIGEVTFDSAAYVARYATKKINGKGKTDHYWYDDRETGETFPLQQEYITMSRNPGIGDNWYEKYKADVFPSDMVVTLRDGKSYINSAPRYYAEKYKEEDPEAYKQLKHRREIHALIHGEDQTPERLDARRICTERKQNQNKRQYENDSENLYSS